MPRLRPDPTFYPSPALAMEAPAEELAYVAIIDPAKQRPDALGVVDVAPGSDTYGRLVHRVEMPAPGDELHHFGWNACSAHLCGHAPAAHVERRFLVVPGIHSSSIHILDTKPDPRSPRLVKTIDGATVAERTGYVAPHTTHCGPDGIYMNALGTPDGGGPGGIFRIDHETFEIDGRWEKDRGPQQLAYDFWWHLGHDVLVSSEWGTPDMVVNGLDAGKLLGGEYGHRLHIWDLQRRTHREAIDLGPEQQMVLELRPAHDPRKAYGFASVVVSLADLSSSIWLWHRRNLGPTNGHVTRGEGEWRATKVIEIPAVPAEAAALPPLLQGFAAVPPLVTDINLSLDDRALYVSCWGTGELRRYDVSDPFHPRLTGTVQLGGIVARHAHPGSPDTPRNGAPQMVEVSRDGSRAYFTNSLYSPWDAQFYPEGIKGWMAKADVRADGTLALDPAFLLEFDDGMRPHQVHLQGGDASSDSFCFP
jgi:selenium-binding protein 1